MLIPIILAFILISASKAEENQTSNDFYPNCDLVAVSHVGIQKNPDTQLVNIEFSWDRKTENYKKWNDLVHSDLDPDRVIQYAVRHGPIVDGKIVDDSIMFIDYPKEDKFTLQNIQPVEQYGIQICTDYDNPFVDVFNPLGTETNVWDHAWTGTMGLSDYIATPTKPVLSDLSDLDYDKPQVISSTPIADVAADDYFFARDTEPPPLTTTSDPAGSKKTLSPRCDLVQTSYVSVQPNPDDPDNAIDVSFSWDRKSSSVELIDSFENYMIRHGVEKTWGGDIDEKDARYESVPVGYEHVRLENITRGTIYGIQICAGILVADGDWFEMAEKSFDWKNEAWIGSMNFTGPEWMAKSDIPAEYDTQIPTLNLDRYTQYDVPTTTNEPDLDGDDTIDTTDENDNPTSDVPITPVTTADSSAFFSWCDLVQTSFVNTDYDKDRKTYSVHFSWMPKEGITRFITSGSRLVIRHGPQNTLGGGIDDDSARYVAIPDLDTNKLTSPIDLINVPAGYYGIQLCIFPSDEDEFFMLAPTNNWKTDAWLGSFDFTSPPGSIDSTSTADVEQDLSIDSYSSDTSYFGSSTLYDRVSSWKSYANDVFSENPSLPYVIVGLVAVLIVLTCIGMSLCIRKRRAQKVKIVPEKIDAPYFIPITKPGMSLP